MKKRLTSKQRWILPDRKIAVTTSSNNTSPLPISAERKSSHTRKTGKKAGQTGDINGAYLSVIPDNDHKKNVMLVLTPDISPTSSSCDIPLVSIDPSTLLDHETDAPTSLIHAILRAANTENSSQS